MVTGSGLVYGQAGYSENSQKNVKDVAGSDENRMENFGRTIEGECETPLLSKFLVLRLEQFDADAVGIG